MKLHRFEHPDFTSNAYVLVDKLSDETFLIDIGEYTQTKMFLNQRKSVKALFLTHAHYDHIYHIHELLKDHPDCRVYASAYALNALGNPKLNLSFYHEDPVCYQGDRLTPISNTDRLSLTQNLTAEVIATPGHTPGCLTYRIGRYLFTGDAYIPGHKVVTKLKGGNREEGAKSVATIKKLLNSGTLLCPGHGPTYQITESNSFSGQLKH
jgi:glyoxylase-like metal-dependent hydrolase (beta-lactamase superfamily II)